MDRLTSIQRFAQPVVRVQGGAVELIPTNSGEWVRLADVEAALASGEDELRIAVDKVAAYFDTFCDDPNDWPGPCDASGHKRKPDGDWICERCASTWWAVDGSEPGLEPRIAAYLRLAGRGADRV
jgi:hypothetical protein